MLAAAITIPVTKKTRHENSNTFSALMVIGVPRCLSVTMDIYSHLMPNMQADAVARVDDVLQNAMLRRSAGEGTENKR